MTTPRRRHHDFQSLMRYRIMDILLVATPYDLFMLEEAGELSERMLGEFRNLDLHYAPGLTGVATGSEAIDLVREHRRFNLVITAPHVGDMNAAQLAHRIRAEGHDVPVVLLARDTRELAEFHSRADTSAIERSFLWQGDARILVAIVKAVEDARNAPHDIREVGVQAILLVEDNVRYYSSFLPVIYAELLHHSQRVVCEGLNFAQKILRMRARPKILLCTNWEEAEATFRDYAEDVLGIISDIEFPRAGQPSTVAGADFARQVRSAFPDVPIILHSSKRENAALARSVGADFLLKGSHLLLQELRLVMLRDFAFGDFAFRLPEGEVVGRAGDLRSLERLLATAPDDSIRFHAERNHFSRWLKARTEFGLAHDLRPQRLDDYPDTANLRSSLISAISAYRLEQSRSVVADFDHDSPDLSSDFYRVGGGSLGGKARGLAFVRRLLSDLGLRRHFSRIEVTVPTSAVLGTDIFDHFLDLNDLRNFAIECEDDQQIDRRFLQARFPEEAARDVAALLGRFDFPLAVRSSSLLEDSRNQPFTGVYDTLMLRNNATSLHERVESALLAIRRVYASTFSSHAKAYLRATSFRLEEEKMAVILQRLVGAARGGRFYPEISGVMRSHNFYPTAPMTAEDGIAAVALGLGRSIVEGGPCLRFCPRFPHHVPQLGSIREMIDSTQRSFFALPLCGATADGGMREESFSLEDAERDGTLGAVGSTFAPENDAVYDGLARPGIRLVTFAPVLKQGLFPLPAILERVTTEAARGLGTPVEIEFAVNLSPSGERAQEFGFLQMRPLALLRETEAVEISETDDCRLLCRSSRVLGNGRIEDLRDIVVVDFQRFERSRSREAAFEIGRLNTLLVGEAASYLLVGVGRWGSRDPWLGIPVTWDDVSGARVIVEAGLRDLDVTPSQGSHFFQNLPTFGVGYFTVNPDAGQGFVDWEWLDSLPASTGKDHVRHIRLGEPLLVLMNGRLGMGLVRKPVGA